MAEWLARNRSNLAASLVVLVTVAGIGLLQVPRRPALQVVSAASAAPIKVHVVGAVRSPGVYQLEGDPRVEDAISAAGGPSESADLVSLNLATPLRDGQQVVIPQSSAPTAGADSPHAGLPENGAVSSHPVSTIPTTVPRSDKVDLNSATKKELEALPGIGPVTAQKILDYRQKNGRFVSIEELRDAKLMYASTYEKIKELVEVR